MGKSIRCKREKRLRAIRREIVEKQPLHQKKEEAKLAALEAALNAPKLPVKGSDNSAAAAMDVAATTSNTNNNDTDVEMGDAYMKALKPGGGIGKKKLKKKFKLGKKNQDGKKRKRSYK